MAIAHGFEELQILSAQVTIAKARNRQRVLKWKREVVEMQKQETDMELRVWDLKRTLDMAVIQALQSVLVFYPPEPIPHERDARPEMPSEDSNISLTNQLALIFFM
jgi:hypothetical protein